MLSKYGRQLLAAPVASVVGWLQNCGITPNAVTAAGFGLTALSAGLLALGQLPIGGGVLLVASLFDLLDGSLARLTAQVSSFGAFLDSTLDRYSESLAFFALAYYYSTQVAAGSAAGTAMLLILATLVGSFMVSYTRARAEALQIECQVGFMQRPERLFILIAGLVTGWMMPALWLLAIFTNITALQRVYEVYKRTTQTQQ